MTFTIEDLLEELEELLDPIAVASSITDWQIYNRWGVADQIIDQIKEIENKARPIQG